jgi:hypothetical protein
MHDNRGHSDSVLMPVVATDGQPDIEVTLSDMAIISAAPELLAASKAALAALFAARTPNRNIRNSDETYMEVSAAMDLLRGAISKADGFQEVELIQRAAMKKAGLEA